MAFLFSINEKSVYPNAETLLISPFKEVWQRDKDKDKHIALAEFAYIEFMSSMKKSNPYRQYAPDKKEGKIIKDLLPDGWEADDQVKMCIHRVIKFQREASSTYNYYMGAKRAAEKMTDFFNDVDINLKNEKSGNPIYKPRDITSAINDLERNLANLKALEKKVEEELYEETKNRSNKEISFFADPESLD
jgi:hypothetical protein